MVPIHPQDQSLLGITWDGRVYIDCALPFGLRSAPKLFSSVADVIAWALYHRGVRSQLHYLDDFLFFGAPHTDEARMPLSIVMNTLQKLGIPVATQKTEGPASCVTFLGIIVDAQALELRLPPYKLAHLQTLLSQWQGRKASTRKELEHLLGHLSHTPSSHTPQCYSQSGLKMVAILPAYLKWCFTITTTTSLCACLL